MAWLHAAFDLAEERRSPGVMIIWQDNPFSTAEPSTLAALKARAIGFGKPVVLVHGDTHVHRLDHPWSDVPKFTRLETYATTQSNRWVKATVDPASSSVQLQEHDGFLSGRRPDELPRASPAGW